MEICQEVEIVNQCRLCGQRNINVNFINIGASEELVLKIRKLLPVVVLIGDPLPQEVCFPCRDNLEAFDAFYEKTKKTESSLKSSLKFIPQDAPSPSNPLIKFHNLIGPSMTHFLQPQAIPSPEERLVETIVNKIRLFSCLDCKRTWVSKAAALGHFSSGRCNDEKEMKVSMTDHKEKEIKDIPVIKKNDNAQTVTKSKEVGCHEPMAKKIDVKAVEHRRDTDQALESEVPTAKAKMDANAAEILTDQRERCFASDSKNNNNYSVKPSVSSSEEYTVGSLKQTGPPKVPRCKESKNPKKLGKRRRGESIAEEEFQLWNQREKPWPKEKAGRKGEKRVCDPNPFECDLCGKLFEYRAELTLHAAVHNATLGLENGVCDTATALNIISCGEGAQSRVSTEAMHPCTFCDLSFKRKATMISHVQSHIEKSFDVTWSDDGT